MTGLSAPVLGIDFGGSSIKAGAVDVPTGEVLGALESVPTPKPATPAAVAESLTALAGRFPQCKGPVGFAYPGVVTHGFTRSAANVDPAWIGTNAATLLERATGRPGWCVNDADAAGVAEMRFGAGRGERGTVLVLTFGTGIGSAMFVGGRLWPNTELGHLELGGREAEHRASARVRAERGLDFRQWSALVNEVLAGYHALFWPDLFIVGGGVSERWEEFGGLLRSESRIVPAQLRQHAGVVGAALYAVECARER